MVSIWVLVRVVDFDLKLKIFVELAVVRVNRNLRSSLNKRCTLSKKKWIACQFWTKLEITWSFGMIKNKYHNNYCECIFQKVKTKCSKLKTLKTFWQNILQIFYILICNTYILNSRVHTLQLLQIYYTIDTLHTVFIIDAFFKYSFCIMLSKI